MTLRHFGIEPPFHMTDYNSRFKQYARLNDDQWRNLIVALIQVINSYVLYAFAFGVLSSDFVVPEGMETHPEFNHFKHPYTTAMIGCLNRVVRVKRRGVLPAGEIVCFIDHDQKHAAKVNRVLSHMTQPEGDFSDVFSSRYAFGSKHRNVPIQAADLIAFECMKRMEHLEIEDRGRPFRKSAQLLFSTVPHEIGYWRTGGVQVVLENLAKHILSKR